ncbi:MAG: hypothetical protein MAG458_01481 [Nitrosopumilus sp.]|nr:hypothetical protein [Nitrosopumilus sp.]
MDESEVIQCEDEISEITYSCFQKILSEQTLDHLRKTLAQQGIDLRRISENPEMTMSAIKSIFGEGGNYFSEAIKLEIQMAFIDFSDEELPKVIKTIIAEQYK